VGWVKIGLRCNVLNDQDLGLSANNRWENSKPGQIPVIAANANKVAGRYKSQWTTANPVSHKPVQITEAAKKKKNRVA
jgi:hypothetical protein